MVLRAVRSAQAAPCGAGSTRRCPAGTAPPTSQEACSRQGCSVRCAYACVCVCQCLHRSTHVHTPKHVHARRSEQQERDKRRRTILQRNRRMAQRKELLAAGKRLSMHPDESLDDALLLVRVRVRACACVSLGESVCACVCICSACMYVWQAFSNIFAHIYMETCAQWIGCRARDQPERAGNKHSGAPWGGRQQPPWRSDRACRPCVARQVASALCTLLVPVCAYL